MTDRSRGASYFDDWYAAMSVSPRKDEIMRRHLGLPPSMPPNNTVPWAGLDEIVAALRLAPGDVLLDLACGRGGVGLEIATRTGARLIGVDFSAEALRQAEGLALQRGVAIQQTTDEHHTRRSPSAATAEFRLGTLTATALESSSVHVVMCIDSIQFAHDQAAAYTEMARVLAPGGRVVLTSWAAVDPEHERVPTRLRAVDLHAGLQGAGFTDIDVRDRADWRAIDRAMMQEAAALEPGDDPALISFRDEGVRSLETFDLVRRVMATAAVPGASASSMAAGEV